MNVALPDYGQDKRIANFLVEHRTPNKKPPVLKNSKTGGFDFKTNLKGVMP